MQNGAILQMNVVGVREMAGKSNYMKRMGFERGIDTLLASTMVVCGQAKRWLYLCGRKYFTKLKQITKDTYICSLHFVGNEGPTDENPEPILATLTENKISSRQSHKRKAPKDKKGYWRKELVQADVNMICFQKREVTSHS